MFSLLKTVIVLNCSTKLALVCKTHSAWLIDHNQAISNFVGDTSFYSNVPLTLNRSDVIDVKEIEYVSTDHLLKKKKTKVANIFLRILTS